MQLRFILAPGLPGFLKLHITDLSESLKQLVKSFARVHIGRIRAIAHHKLMHGFVTVDAALALLEMIEESFLIIVGSRHTRHAIASEQAPPTIADGFDQVPGDWSIFGVGCCAPLQFFQECGNLPLHLLRPARLTVFIFGA